MGDTESRTDILALAPVKLVVAQVRFERHTEIAEPAFVRKFTDEAGGDPVRVQPASTQNIVVGPMGEIDKDEEKGWSLLSEDGWKVTVFEGSLTVETTQYVNWTNFRSRFHQSLVAMEATVGPATEQRLGLRYVDELSEEVTEPNEWLGRVRDELLGPVLHGDFGPSMRTAEQRFSMSYEGGVGCLVRHGFSLDQSNHNYVLDTDVYRATQSVYDKDSVRDAFDDFHSKASSVFKGSLTQAYFDELRHGR